MSSLRTAVASSLVPWLLAELPAQGTRWHIPDHGAVVFAEDGVFLGQKRDGTRLRLFDAASTVCQPVLFADELQDGGRRWNQAPWSLASLPVWLAMDLTTWDAPGPVRHVWPRIDEFGEVTFAGTAERPQQDGWQRITGKLTRAPVRERPGASPREIDSDRHYMGDGLELRLDLRRRFEPDRLLSGRYAPVGVVSAIEWTLEGRVDAVHQKTELAVSGKRTWKLLAVRGNRHGPFAQEPGFDALVDKAAADVVARQLGDLEKPQGPLAAGEHDGSITGPSLHAAMLHGLARAGERAGSPVIDAALAALLQRRQTEPHSHALTILANAGLHAPADERALWLAGRPPRVTLPRPMRDAMARHVQALLRLWRQVDGGEQGFWSHIEQSSDRSMFHSCVAIQALDAATRCGVAVPPSVFDDFARHLVATAIAVDVPRAAVVRPEVGSGAPGRGGRDQRGGGSSGSACGWTDSDLGAFSVNGADVAWAIAALLACERHSRDQDLRRRCLECVERGWSWLGHSWTSRHCPSEMPVQRQWRHSFVQAMAWLLDESGVRFVDARDVYFELATVLLLETQKGGVASTVADAPAALSLWRRGGLVVTPAATGR